jgi:hypothetical protein
VTHIVAAFCYHHRWFYLIHSISYSFDEIKFNKLDPAFRLTILELILFLRNDNIVSTQFDVLN